MALTRITEENITPGSITANSIAEGISLGGGGGVSNASVYLFDTNVTSNIVISEGQNGLSVGPIVIADGVSVNIAANSRWLIL